MTSYWVLLGTTHSIAKRCKLDRLYNNSKWFFAGLGIAQPGVGCNMCNAGGVLSNSRTIAHFQRNPFRVIGPMGLRRTWDDEPFVPAHSFLSHPKC